jgi:hypothetical protein
VDARASPLLEARHKPGAWLEGRSTLRIVEEEEKEETDDGPAGRARPRPGRTLGDNSGGASQSARAKRGTPLLARPARSPPRRRSDNEHAYDDADDDDLDGRTQEDRERRRRRRSQPDDENLAWLESAWWPFAGGGRPGRASAAVLHERLPEPVALASDNNGPRAGPPTRGAGDKRLVAELLVDSLSSEDNGLYKCRVDFRRSRSRVEQLELKIIGKRQRPPA